MTQARTWRTFAQRQKTDQPGEEFAYFGPPGYARLGAGVGVCEVELVEDPEGPYWSWLDVGGAAPTTISSSHPQLHRKFLANDLDAYGPDMEQAHGRGTIVRLQIHEVTAQAPELHEATR